MKNTRYNVKRGMINDSDSYASEIGTVKDTPTSGMRSYDFDP